MSESNSMCKLQMLDFYFPKSSVDFNKGEFKQSKIDTNIKINYARNANDGNMMRIQIDTTVNNENNSLSVYVQAVGVFKLDMDNMEKEVATRILVRNTVAIMFPFIRSQVSLMTTQPGMTPIMIQPIDANSIKIE